LNFLRSGKHKNERTRELANPDFVERLKTDAQLIEPGRTTFYGGDSKGYIDYPLLKSK
jgi:2,4-dienoyl-CoA reductase-like NADH-dependent reductase (Old Yellow Enzyme family)